MELELMVEGGMPERDVIVAATATNAEIPGISHNAGTLEAGKIAGVLRQVDLVMKEGRVAWSKIEGVPAT